MGMRLCVCGCVCVYVVHLQGYMLLNKRPMTESLLKASSQYCKQDVLLYEAMTVHIFMNDNDDFMFLDIRNNILFIKKGRAQADRNLLTIYYFNDSLFFFAMMALFFCIHT